MDFQLSEEHRLIQETARRIARDRIAPRAAEIDETGEYPHDIFEAFREVGLLGLTIPQAYGGGGAGTLPLALAVEEAAKYCCSSGLMLLLSALSTHPILLGGSERQKQAWLPRPARGELKGAFCLSEPNAGSDAAAIESRAIRDGDDYVLNGEKVFISGGTVADFVIAFAKTDSADGARSIAGFIVPTDSPGFSVARTDRKMGVRGVPTANIVFENVRVPRELLLGEEEGHGFQHAMLTLNTCRPVVGARGLGLAQGKKLDDILRELGHVAEGVYTAAAVEKRALQLGIDMPITQSVCAVLFGGVSPREAVEQLLARDPKGET